MTLHVAQMLIQLRRYIERPVCTYSIWEIYKNVNEGLNCCSQTYASVDKMATEPVTLTPDKDGALRWPGLGE